MKRILVFGSSHVGAVKAGIDSTSVPESMHFDFLALPAGNFQQISVSNGSFVIPDNLLGLVKSIFGYDKLPLLHEYDCLLFCAGASKLSLALYSNNRQIPLLSKSIVDAIVKSVDIKVFRQIQLCMDPSRIVYLGAPLLSESIHENRHIRHKPLLDSKLESLRAGHLVDLIRECCLESAGNNRSPTFLLPPPHLLTQDQFNTRDEFIRGGLRLDKQPRVKGKDADYERDMGHGNSRYGEEVAKLIVSDLSALF